jgi:hypothetical protein
LYFLLRHRITRSRSFIAAPPQFVKRTGAAGLRFFISGFSRANARERSDLSNQQPSGENQFLQSSMQDS